MLCSYKKITKKEKRMIPLNLPNKPMQKMNKIKGTQEYFGKGGYV
jgi:hypothetical protein